MEQQEQYVLSSMIQLVQSLEELAEYYMTAADDVRANMDENYPFSISLEKKLKEIRTWRDSYARARIKR
ncbi:hypothetical protein [Psychrobacillus sp. MER TA 171]|uniref:hypothetical protein n=1 Tax=Psychrobacillus sp. MER TA 171 TaxID=2939577 RepID=UPI00203E1C9C|nr:hypothetical protein [Psychrobacillus sp. MER TA 171]MCM3358130.1 hypothetical protein [Psychrobacillus sp. MER TA 171]